jgi:uncharacterized RDD family membrane protein YckC
MPGWADPAGRVRWIATPEGISVPFQVAGAGDRIAAFGIDFMILIVFSVLVFLVALFALPFGAGEIGFSAALLAGFLFRNFYFTALELKWGGATVGKKIARTRVIARDGGPLPAGAVFARNLTRDVELFLPLTALMEPRLLVGSGPGWGVLLAIGWLFVFAAIPFMNKDRLRVGDLIAGTMVVRNPVSMLLPDLADTTASAPLPELGFTREQLDLYGIKELQVLEDLLRRYDMGAVRVDTLDLVCDKIKRKIGWPVERWNVETMTFLRAFYGAQRGRLEQKLLFGTRQEEKKI